MKNTQHLIYMSLLVVIALILSLLEKSISLPIIIPGIKIGLANLITLIALYTLSCKSDIFKIIFARLLLGAIFGGNVSNLMYSISGALASFISMTIIKETFTDKISIMGVSAVGAIFHNIGQILIAILVLRNIGICLYLPILSITGAFTGIFIGYVAKYTLYYMERISVFNERLSQN